MNKTITIEDIARQAGVSPSTVSRVLNGSKRVAEDKRLQVLAAVEEHQYRPNPVARGLVRGRSMTIGVLIQDISSPFFARMISGIEQGLQPASYQPMFASTHWRAEDQEESLQLLLDRRVDGLIVQASSIPDQVLREVATHIPLIITARRVAGLEAQCLYIDNHEGAYRATRYLIGLGHTRIAHISGTRNHPDAIDRLAGYQQALADAGIAIDDSLVADGMFTEESGVSAVETLLARGEQFSALFAANDQSAYGAMLGLYNHGYRIPTDMSLVGFDDQFLSAYTLPPLTTVRQPSTEMGQLAAEAMLHLLDKGTVQLPQLANELIIRKSAVHIRKRE